jgi:phosphoenolpyruvate carboxykinase (ATP)
MMPSSDPFRLASHPQVKRNPSIEELSALALAHDDDRLTDTGAIAAYSGKYTGRVPAAKFTVQDEVTEAHVWWDNNHALSPETFERLRVRLCEYAAQRPLFVIDTFAGADPKYRIAVRFVVERPYHAFFIRQLLIRPTPAELESFMPDWHILDVGRLSLAPSDGTGLDALVGLDFLRRLGLIAGTQYAGEMKKSVFTIMNFLLPRQGVLSMHCSANVGADGDTALFFGLSGTGKTTLSADPERRLIGDDEHGWSDDGVFNIEGGCYAKCIDLSAEREPEIFAAIRAGAILENVVVDPNGRPDFADRTITENTRAAYPLDHIPNALEPSVGGHPRNIVFLTCDALGVLPPIALLSSEQARQQFLNGYTCKLAGTEVGVVEPQITFSACFGQPFLPLPPRVYGTMLAEKIERHGARVWLVNTGWSGGPYGTGARIRLKYTRAMLHAAFSGQLDHVEHRTDPVFGLSVPVTCPGVPDEILDPRRTWAEPEAYDAAAQGLKDRFDANFRQYS